MAFSDFAVAQGIRTSDFGGTLDTFWLWRNPAGDATLTMTATHAQISVPGPNAHEPVSFFQGGNRTPRLIQRVAAPGADVGNFDVYARFDGIQDRMYTMQGIQAVQDNKNLVRAEIYSDSTALNWLLFTFDNNGSYVHQRVGQTIAPYGFAPIYVRLKRVDSVFTLYYSYTPPSWTQVDTARHHILVDSIGVYAANGDSVLFATNTSPPFMGKIDYFANWSGTFLPIQLGRFTATLLSDRRVRLDWMTITETNNYGFEVQKSLSNANNFETIANSFIPGNGTTVEPRSYHWIDYTTTAGNWFYRLKQIDLDGTIHYTEPVGITIVTSVDDDGIPTTIALRQNYPNPFNPSTNIAFRVPAEATAPAGIADFGLVTLKVYDVLGREVSTLVNEKLKPGSYEVTFDAGGLASGVYVYKLTAGDVSLHRKMMLAK
jgi:hypothetical protein